MTSFTEKLTGHHKKSTASGAPYQIRVRRKTSGDLWIQVTAHTTIKEIKRKVFEDGAIPPNAMRLTYEEKILSDDNETLEQAGITSEAILWVEAL